MNDIMNLLDIVDENILFLGTEISGNKKIITIEKKLEPHYCPDCGMKMYSRGPKIRIVKHSVLQDGYEVYLKVKQRRWECIDINCKRNISDSFKFLSKNKRITNTTDLLIVNAFKDYKRTAADIARQFNISDHHALNVFDRYVQLKRMPLPEILCVDEVHMDMDNNCKYVLVLQNFKTGETVDLVESRRKNTTEDYFLNIPKSERDAVKYLISDMYNPYINYCDKYFKNAVSIVDSFHVMQWIIRKLENYIRALLRTYRERDARQFEDIPEEKRRNVNIPVSDEVYLLQNYRWLLLKNQSDIDYTLPARKNYHFGRLMGIYDYEALFFALDENLSALRDLKEEYVLFNTTHYDDPEEAAKALDLLIDRYANCSQKIFNDFSTTLSSHRQSIINSFTYASRLRGSDEFYDSRLSNGPMESLNRKAKDMKRNCRGFTNFSHLRNRFLFSTRRSPAIDGTRKE